ncbi:MAG TPA: hypothetical protein VGN70_03360 [Gammaproteobacteria bacterium]
MKILRSIGAISAGLLTLVVLCVITDAVLVKLNLLPSPDAHRPHTLAFLGVVIAYCTIYTLVGGYVTARLAPIRPAAHAVMMGVAGMAMSTFGTMHNWQIGDGWNAITVVAEGIPLSWLGALVWTQIVRRHRSETFMSQPLT